MDKPEYHVNHTSEEHYQYEIMDVKAKQSHIECKLSKEDIGNLLQGKAIYLLFLNDGYEASAMIDIKMTDYETEFNVSDEIVEKMNGDNVTKNNEVASRPFRENYSRW